MNPRNTDPRPTTYAEWEDLEAERDALRAELERTKEELENARNALEEAVRVITSDNPAICDMIWTGRPGETLLDHLQAALERKDGA